MPSDFALHYLAFIKMVNGAEGEENKTPVIHLKMLDTLIKEQDTANLLFRGAAKTTVFGEYGSFLSHHEHPFLLRSP